VCLGGGGYSVGRWVVVVVAGGGARVRGRGEQWWLMMGCMEVVLAEMVSGEWWQQWWVVVGLTAWAGCMPLLHVHAVSFLAVWAVDTPNAPV
jgi:hypothetical protein